MLTNINEVINAIKSKEYDLARKYLIAEMIENDHSAEVYNLLGIISEYRGDHNMACIYYRASYVFDPTYKPADKNLERVTSFFYIFNGENIDFGDGMEKEYKKSCFAQYNTMHIGHSKNNQVDRKSVC